MKKITQNLKKRLLSFMAVMLLIFANTGTAFAAGTETLEPGITEMGDFVFNDTNVTPVKTINGSHVTIYVNWRRADGLYGAPNVDAGLGDVKLTLKILDSSGNSLTSPQVFYYDDSAVNGYVTDEISLDVTSGQKIRIWMDASSVNPSASNGNYRSIYIRSFGAEVRQ